MHYPWFYQLYRLLRYLSNLYNLSTPPWTFSTSYSLTQDWNYWVKYLLFLYIYSTNRCFNHIFACPSLSNQHNILYDNCISLNLPAPFIYLDLMSYRKNILFSITYFILPFDRSVVEIFFCVSILKIQNEYSSICCANSSIRYIIQKINYYYKIT